MKTFRLSDMKKGWFVGDFAPTCLASADCEVACKHYRVGETEGRHFHRIATEVTLVVQGRVRMNEEILSAGEIVVLDPGEATDFAALEDAVTVVVKLPCVAGDKYDT